MVLKRWVGEEENENGRRKKEILLNILKICSYNEIIGLGIFVCIRRLKQNWYRQY